MGLTYGTVHLEWNYLKAVGARIHRESPRVWRFSQPWWPKDEDLNAVWYHPSAAAGREFADTLARVAPAVARCLEWPAAEGRPLPTSPSLLAHWIADEVWWMIGTAVDVRPIANLTLRPIARAVEQTDYLSLWQGVFGSWRPDLLAQRLQFARWSMNQPGMGGLLAYWGSVPVGSCDSFHERGKVRAENLWVDPAYRGRGVGSRRLAAICASASMTLATVPADADIFNFYRALGFRRLAIQRLWSNPEW